MLEIHFEVILYALWSGLLWMLSEQSFIILVFIWWSNKSCIGAPVQYKWIASALASSNIHLHSLSYTVLPSYKVLRYYLHIIKIKNCIISAGVTGNSYCIFVHMAWKVSICIPPVRKLETSSHVLYHPVMLGLRWYYLLLKQKNSEDNSWYQVFVVRRGLERWFPNSWYGLSISFMACWPVIIGPSLGSGLWILYWKISRKHSVALHYLFTANGNVMCCAVERLIYYLHKIVWRTGKYSVSDCRNE
jgi:hypothetical protein